MAGSLLGADRKVDPTFLHRFLPAVQEAQVDLSTPTCHYKPIFGLGDSETSIVKGVSRFGEITIDPGGACRVLSHPREEQIYVFLEGTGLVQYEDQKISVQKHDFMYLPPTISHGIANPFSQTSRVILIGYKIPAGVSLTIPPRLLVANLGDVKKQAVGNHPPSTLYQLLMGDFNSQRDKIAAGHMLTSLFTMEIAPGGTNQPHHHPTEEEIYLVLEGEGDIVAGGGINGIEGRHPAKAGDAYFFRLNCTVGFYASEASGAGKALILAVRSRYPF
ncbi:MAG: cupin domain-containing protein [Acidobacteriota bacterium]